MFKTNSDLETLSQRFIIFLKIAFAFSISPKLTRQLALLYKSKMYSESSSKPRLKYSKPFSNTHLQQNPLPFSESNIDLSLILKYIITPQILKFLIVITYLEKLVIKVFHLLKYNFII